MDSTVTATTKQQPAQSEDRLIHVDIIHRPTGMMQFWNKLVPGLVIVRYLRHVAGVSSDELYQNHASSTSSSAPMQGQGVSLYVASQQDIYAESVKKWSGLHIWIYTSVRDSKSHSSVNLDSLPTSFNASSLPSAQNNATTPPREYTRDMAGQDTFQLSNRSYYHVDKVDGWTITEASDIKKLLRFTLPVESETVIFTVSLDINEHV